MDSKALLKRKVAYFVYSSILVISIITMLLGIRLILMEGHEQIVQTVATNIANIHSSFTKGAEAVLKDSGQEIIRLKAEKVAKDIENYLIRHPRATIKGMQNDPQFKPLAIQPVGKTGYTAVHESKTSINRFHINPKIINTNLGALAGVLPDFWVIIVASKEGKNAGGYYKWREADGSVREKYMWVATLSRPTADDIILDVAATTYIDEFMQPLAQLSEKLVRESAAASARVGSLSESILNKTLVAIVIIILIFLGIGGYMAVRLIQGYRRIEREVEERKKIESELQKLAAVVEHSSELVNLAALDGKMIFLNEAGGIMLGIPPGDVEKYSFMEVIPDELKSKVENEVLPAILKQGRWEGDLQYCNLITGALIDVHAMTFAIRNSDGAPLYLANVSLDITSRKQAEGALKKSERNLSDIVEFLPDATFVIDLDGKVIAWNRAIEEMTGILKEGMIGQGDHAYAIPFYGERRRQLLDLIDLSDKELESKYKSIQRKGNTLYAEAFTPALYGGKGAHVWATGASLFDDSGNRVGAIESIRDITKHKQAEEEKRSLEGRLNRAEKMEALGTLAGGVAHDLNNVLGVVVGYAELILMKADASSPIRPQLVNIMNGGLKAAAIVDDLLTLARRGVSDREVLNLNKIIADCQKSPEFEKLYSYHPSVKIKTEIDPDLLNISGSSVHLGKSLYNLISNASEAMPKGGTATIKTTNQYLDKPIRGYDNIQEGDYVVLSVSDEGEGISADNLERIFEPFYTKKVMGRSGTGLGLAVVWGTVKDHQGYINVQSEEGKGSTFTLYFPVIKEDITAEAVAVQISEYIGSGESILVVDDIQEQRDLAAGMLRTLNYNVASVESGEEAVAYMKDYQADLIVLDMIMDPGMDGLDTYKSILEVRPKQKAIIVSGFSESDRVQAARGLGAGAYVRKPYVIEKLGLAVKNELERPT